MCIFGDIDTSNKQIHVILVSVGSILMCTSYLYCIVLQCILYLSLCKCVCTSVSECSTISILYIIINERFL